MLRNTFFATLVITLGLLALPALAANEDREIGKKRTFTFHSEVYVGDVQLEPGEYRMQHVNRDGGHFVLFTDKYGREEFVQVPCEIESLGEKNRYTQVYSASNHVTEIRLEGENVSHILQR